MRRIAKIVDEIENYIRLDKIDEESFNVWINKSILIDVDDTVGFVGDASNMDLEKDYDCRIDSDFKYYDMTVLEAIMDLKEDVHNYLIDEGDDEDFVEILLDKIVLNK